MLAVGSISTVSFGQSSFNIRPGNLDTSTGTWVSPVDNPIAYAVLPLTELESVELRDDGWDDYGFYLEGVQTCSPSDTQCVPVAGVGDTEVHSVWPTALGNWVGPMSIMVEQPNAALGTMRTTFEFTKYDYYRNEIPLATGSAALASDVIVVPVNVVVAVPAESIDPIGHDVANSVAEPALFRALFDNQWEVDTTRSSDPGGLNRAFYGGYLTRTTLHPSSTASLIRRVTRLTYDNINPDDVFAQCGIQFRLASVLVYEVSNEEDIFFVGKCSSANNGESALSEVHNRMVGDARREPTLAYGTFAENGIEILFSPRIEDCEDVVGLASPGYQIAAIRLIPKNISAPELTLSHEIGHLLGLE